MYSYITPRDVNGSTEGQDDEANGMGTLFEYPMDDDMTFNYDPSRPFAFDGVGQIIVNEQLEQLTLPQARKVMNGLGKTASTLEPNQDWLPPAPAGEKWRLIGPSPLGTGYNWKTVPVDAPEPEEDVDIEIDEPTLIERIKQNKTVAGISAAVILGGLWWLFRRKGE